MSVVEEEASIGQVGRPDEGSNELNGLEEDLDTSRGPDQWLIDSLAAPLTEEGVTGLPLAVQTDAAGKATLDENGDDENFGNAARTSTSARTNPVATSPPPSRGAAASPLPTGGQAVGDVATDSTTSNAHEPRPASASQAAISDTEPAVAERPATGRRPATRDRPPSAQRPTTSARPATGQRPATSERPATGQRPATGDRPDTGSAVKRPTPRSSSHEARIYTGQPVAADAVTGEEQLADTSAAAVPQQSSDQHAGSSWPAAAAETVAPVARLPTPTAQQTTEVEMPASDDRATSEPAAEAPQAAVQVPSDTAIFQASVLQPSDPQPDMQADVFRPVSSGSAGGGRATTPSSLSLPRPRSGGIRVTSSRMSHRSDDGAAPSASHAPVDLRGTGAGHVAGSVGASAGIVHLPSHSALVRTPSNLQFRPPTPPGHSHAGGNLTPTSLAGQVLHHSIPAASATGSGGASSAALDRVPSSGGLHGALTSHPDELPSIPEAAAVPLPATPLPGAVDEEEQLPATVAASEARQSTRGNTRASARELQGALAPPASPRQAAQGAYDEDAVPFNDADSLSRDIKGAGAAESPVRGTLHSGAASEGASNVSPFLGPGCVTPPPQAAPAEEPVASAAAAPASDTDADADAWLSPARLLFLRWLRGHDALLRGTFETAVEDAASEVARSPSESHERSLPWLRLPALLAGVASAGGWPGMVDHPQLRPLALALPIIARRLENGPRDLTGGVTWAQLKAHLADSEAAASRWLGTSGPPPVPRPSWGAVGAGVSADSTAGDRVMVDSVSRRLSLAHSIASGGGGGGSQGYADSLTGSMRGGGGGGGGSHTAIDERAYGDSHLPRAVPRRASLGSVGSMGSTGAVRGQSAYFAPAESHMRGAGGFGGAGALGGDPYSGLGPGEGGPGEGGMYDAQSYPGRDGGAGSFNGYGYGGGDPSEDEGLGSPPRRRVPLRPFAGPPGHGTTQGDNDAAYYEHMPVPSPQRQPHGHGHAQFGGYRPQLPEGHPYEEQPQPSPLRRGSMGSMNDQYTGGGGGGYGPQPHQHHHLGQLQAVGRGQPLQQHGGTTTTGAAYRRYSLDRSQPGGPNPATASLALEAAKERQMQARRAAAAASALGGSNAAATAAVATALGAGREGSGSGSSESGGASSNAGDAASAAPGRTLQSVLRRYARGLRTLFSHYAFQTKKVGREPTFETLAARGPSLNRAEFARAVRDLGLQGPLLPRGEVEAIARGLVTGHGSVLLDEAGFIEGLCRCAISMLGGLGRLYPSDADKVDAVLRR